MWSLEVSGASVARSPNTWPTRVSTAAFGDAGMGDVSAAQILDLISTKLALAVTGCHVAVNHFLAHGRGGAIVNVPSHQAQRPVRGALPYATAKAAVEGLTRAMAVDHGPAGIRTNAVALGSIATDRFERYRAPVAFCCLPPPDSSVASSSPSTADEQSTGLIPRPPDSSPDHCDGDGAAAASKAGRSGVNAARTRSGSDPDGTTNPGIDGGTVLDCSHC